MTPWSLLVPRKALRWGRLTQPHPLATGGPIPSGQPTIVGPDDFPLIRREDNPS